MKLSVSKLKASRKTSQKMKPSVFKLKTSHKMKPSVSKLKASRKTSCKMKLSVFKLKTSHKMTQDEAVNL